MPRGVDRSCRERVHAVVAGGVRKRVLERGERIGRVDRELEVLTRPLVRYRDPDSIRLRIPQQGDIDAIADSMIQLADQQLSIARHEVSSRGLGSRFGRSLRKTAS